MIGLRTITGIWEASLSLHVSVPEFGFCSILIVGWHPSEIVWFGTRESGALDPRTRTRFADRGERRLTAPPALHLSWLQVRHHWEWKCSQNLVDAPPHI